MKRKTGAQEEKERIDMRDIKLPFFKEGEDIDKYLQYFEKMALTAKWEQKSWGARLAACLQGKAKEAVTNMDAESFTKYEEEKKTLLAFYRVDADTYRIKFRNLQRDKDETPAQTLHKLTHLFREWLKIEGVDNGDPKQIILT